MQYKTCFKTTTKSPVPLEDGNARIPAAINLLIWKCGFINHAWMFASIGAFFIPYLIFLFTCGIPVFFLETALGQYTSQGGVTAWRRLCPLFEGELEWVTRPDMSSILFPSNFLCLVANPEKEVSFSLKEPPLWLMYFGHMLFSSSLWTCMYSVMLQNYGILRLDMVFSITSWTSVFIYFHSDKAIS